MLLGTDFVLSASKNSVSKSKAKRPSTRQFRLFLSFQFRRTLRGAGSARKK